jgi:plastocyanin
MTKTLIITVGVVIVLVVGGFFLLNKNQSAQNSSMNMTPTQTQNSNQTETQSPAGTNEVNIANFVYSPETITVKVGDKVTWTNKDSVGHSATADDNSWDTGVFGQGESKSITFDKAGTYSYHCSVHSNMHGTVIVQAQ